MTTSTPSSPQSPQVPPSVPKPAEQQKQEKEEEKKEDSSDSKSLKKAGGQSYYSSFNGSTIYKADGSPMRFVNGQYETSDPEEIKQLDALAAQGLPTVSKTKLAVQESDAVVMKEMGQTSQKGVVSGVGTQSSLNALDNLAPSQSKK